MKFKRSITFVLTVMVALALTHLPVPARDQALMRAAKQDLEKAHQALKRAAADKGGHRVRALELISQAIAAVSDGIKYDRANPNDRPRRNGDLIEKEFSAAGNSFDQKNMRQARAHLGSALDSLNRATADKGGYRVRAMNLVREAIAEVDRGIEYDRRN